MQQILYQYAVLLHPTQEEAKTGVKTTIIKPPTFLLSTDARKVGIVAARELDEKYVDKLDQVEVIVRPF